MLKKYLLKRDQFQQKGCLQGLSKHLNHPELWQFHRHAVAKGVAFGLLSAFIPLPGQTLLVALLAYAGRANLPIALAMTWVTNPITFVPINYAIYKLGQWLTGDAVPYHSLTKFHWQGASLSETGQHFWQWLSSLGKPFLIGSTVMSIACAVLGYILVQSIWRLAVFLRNSRL